MVARTRRRVAVWILAGLALALLGLQVPPYGRERTNPPVTAPFVWRSAEAERIARTSCYDCHSNETRWWWATRVAPVSWLTARAVREGRRRLNFSEWRGDVTVAALADAVDGRMPPLQYVLVHWSARLNDRERRVLVEGFAVSLPAQPE